jgi:hypothetical protein
MPLLFVKPTMICDCNGQYYWKECPHGGYWECQSCGDQVKDDEMSTEIDDLTDEETATLIIALRHLVDYLGIDDHALAKVRYHAIEDKYRDILGGMSLLNPDQIEDLILEKVNAA